MDFRILDNKYITGVEQRKNPRPCSFSFDSTIEVLESYFAKSNRPSETSIRRSNPDTVLISRIFMAQSHFRSNKEIFS